MIRSSPNVGSIALAVPLAGPIFVIFSFLIAPIGATGPPSSSVSGMATAFSMMLVLSAMFGGILALPPCLIAAAGMAALGRINEAMQLPVAWGLAGAFSGGLLGALSSDGTAVASLGATDAVCALVCRCGVTWCDENSAIVPPRETAICMTHDT